MDAPEWNRESRASSSTGLCRAERSRHTLSLRTHTHRPEVPLSQYLLKLYVTGKSPKADAAIANLRRICDEELAENYELQIIDVLEHPQLAEDDKILATPTLIKRLPPPLRRVIGDLSDRHKVLLGLYVRPDAKRSYRPKRPVE
jgi:circadian clock protein KaiB